MRVDTSGKKRLSRDHFAAGFQLAGCTIEKRNGALQVMQHVCERNNIKAVVFDRVQLVDFVAVKHKIEIIQIKHVACNYV